MTDKKQNYSLSYLRAIACIAIIVIHTVRSGLIVFQNTLNRGEVSFYNGIMNNMMWAVPVFLLVSSSLLLNPDREITLGKILRKYVLRIVLSLAFFGVIYTVCDMWMNQETTVQAFETGMYRVFAGTSWSHLWYLYCLIGLYLMLPFFRKTAAGCSEREYRDLLLVLLIFLSIVPLLKELGVEIGFYIPISGIYPLYFFGGYYLMRYGTQGGRGRLALTVILCTAVIAVLTWLKISRGVAVPENLFSYASILVVMQAAALFRLAVSFSPDGTSFFGKVLLSLDRHSFCIYLVHLIFIRILLRVFSFNPFFYGPWMVAGLVLGNLALSWGISWVLRKIPGLRSFL